MPLTGYMRTTDPGRISSISGYLGDKTRRKKIRPITHSSNDAEISMYVMDCGWHNLSKKTGGVVVPVFLKELVRGVGWGDLGMAKCCPLCWRILEPPVGMVLPEPDIQVFELGAANKSTKKTASHRRKVSIGVSDKPTSYVKSQQILSFLKPIGSADIYEIMAAIEVSRATAIKYMNFLIKNKKVTAERSLGGKGNRTQYKAP